MTPNSADISFLSSCHTTMYLHAFLLLVFADDPVNFRHRRSVTESCALVIRLSLLFQRLDLTLL